MIATLARKVRHSDAAFAIEATQKTLRNWDQRKLVQIFTPKPETGWIEYTFADIAILALVRHLANFGVAIEEASQIANTIIRDFFPDVLAVHNPENMPAGALASMWANRRLHVFKVSEGWKMQIATLWESNLDPMRDKGFDPTLPSGVASIRREQEPASIFLVINVEAVLNTAFARAIESVTDTDGEDIT